MVSSPNHTPAGILWDYQACIEPAQLAIGHFVARLDRPWGDSPFAMQGVMVSDSSIRAWMTTHCAWVVIDLKRSENKTRPPELTGVGAGGTAFDQLEHPRNVLRQYRINRRSMRTALSHYGVLGRQTRRFLNACAAGQSLDIQAAEAAIHSLAETLEHNLAALVWLTRIKQQDDYTAEHCINVAVLAMGLAYALEWPREEIELAGMAGLLHDLGKMRVDSAILNKPGRLTPDEYEHLKTHTTLGYELLRRDPDVPAPVTQVVLDHHERPDGQGYPNARAAHEVGPLSSLVAVVDSYDAITSNRVYDAARSHHEALGILWRQRDKQFDATLVEAFIQFMGWVTPGTLVRLSTGDIAVVIQANHGRRLKPVVRLLVPDGDGYHPGDEWNLAELAPSEGEPWIRIRDVLPDGAEGVDLRALTARLFP